MSSGAGYVYVCTCVCVSGSVLGLCRTGICPAGPLATALEAHPVFVLNKRNSVAPNPQRRIDDHRVC